VALGRREVADRRVRHVVLLATVIVAGGLLFQVSFNTPTYDYVPAPV